MRMRSLSVAFPISLLVISINNWTVQIRCECFWYLRIDKREKRKPIHSNPVCKYPFFSDLLECPVANFIFNLKHSNCEFGQDFVVRRSTMPMAIDTSRCVLVIWLKQLLINSISVFRIESETVPGDEDDHHDDNDGDDDDTFNLIVLGSASTRTFLVYPYHADSSYSTWWGKLLP